MSSLVPQINRRMRTHQLIHSQIHLTDRFWDFLCLGRLVIIFQVHAATRHSSTPSFVFSKSRIMRSSIYLSCTNLHSTSEGLQFQATSNSKPNCYNCNHLSIIFLLALMLGFVAWLYIRIYLFVLWNLERFKSYLW